jgi:plasmid stabilization system protein ParE
MVKRIIWSANALSDRIEILDYWYQRIGNKNYSRKLDKSLKNLIRHLVKFPEMGRKLENRDERFLVKDAYQIFYAVIGDKVVILHIWDSRRNPDDLNLD